MITAVRDVRLHKLIGIAKLIQRSISKYLVCLGWFNYFHAYSYNLDSRWQYTYTVNYSGLDNVLGMLLF